MTLLDPVGLIMIVSMMLGTGLQVDRHHLRETLRKVERLVRVFLANVILVPSFAVLMVWLFHVDKGVAIGIVPHVDGSGGIVPCQFGGTQGGRRPACIDRLSPV